MRVLLIEDNPHLVRSLVSGMSKAGMVVDVVGDGLHADQLLRVEDYDVAVLDLALPRLDGMEVLRRARERGNDVPVLILTASGELSEKVRGLNAGADDYLPKPFELDELVARLHAIARRRVGRAHAVFQVGRLSYDTASLLFTIDAQALAAAATGARRAGSAGEPGRTAGQQGEAERPAVHAGRCAESSGTRNLRAPAAQEAAGQRGPHPHPARARLHAGTRL